MAILELNLAVQDLGIDEARKLVELIESLGGTANGKVKIVNLDTGEVDKALFVLNNDLCEQLFKEGTDNGHDDDPVSGSTPTIPCGCACDHCSCDDVFDGGYDDDDVIGYSGSGYQPARA